MLDYLLDCFTYIFKTKRFSLYASSVDGKKHPIMFWILYILCLGCFIWLSIRYL